MHSRRKLGTHAIARLVGVSPSTVLSWIDRGLLEASGLDIHHLGYQNTLLFPLVGVIKLGKRLRLRSRLDEVPGVGPKTRARLLKNLGSVRAVQEAGGIPDGFADVHTKRQWDAASDFASALGFG